MLSNLWSKEEDKDKLSIVISFYGLPIYGTNRDQLRSKDGDSGENVA